MKSADKRAGKECSSCLCQSEVRLKSDDGAQPVAYHLPLLFPSLPLANIHPLSLSPLEIIVYFDSQTLPLSRDLTLQIYSTYFYQPQNAPRQGKQGSESLGFNLLSPPSSSSSSSTTLPPPTPTTLSSFVSKSLFTFTPSTVCCQSTLF